jgi:hypothetical protein
MMIGRRISGEFLEFFTRFVSISPGKIGSLVGLKRDLNAGTVGSQCNI